MLCCRTEACVALVAVEFGSEQISVPKLCALMRYAMCVDLQLVRFLRPGGAPPVVHEVRKCRNWAHFLVLRMAVGIMMAPARVPLSTAPVSLPRVICSTSRSGGDTPST